MNELVDGFYSKIKTLSETVWERRAGQNAVEEWLGNFEGLSGDQDTERLHALHLLSQFMFFGMTEMRELLKSLYRDLFRYPVVRTIRERHGDTTDLGLIEAELRQELQKTRFLGIGNPSESGCHLLYYFRQENGLPKDLFIHTHQIFTRDSSGDRLLRQPDVERYIFIDDLCASGSQASTYSTEFLLELKALGPSKSVHYYAMFAAEDGLNWLCQNTEFDDVECLFLLDRSYKCFDQGSRYYYGAAKGIDRDFAESMCRQYGTALMPRYPLGYGDCQLLLGFHHNTPNNALPVFWYDEPSGAAWKPIFRRYPKYYGSSGK